MTDHELKLLRKREEIAKELYQTAGYTTYSVNPIGPDSESMKESSKKEVLIEVGIIEELCGMMRKSYEQDFDLNCAVVGRHT